MSKIAPDTPVRADHRFILRLSLSLLGGRVAFIPSELSRISRVFKTLGGSWERVHQGSPSDISLLKKVLKVAFKKGYLTKQEKWEGK